MRFHKTHAFLVNARLISPGKFSLKKGEMTEKSKYREIMFKKKQAKMPNEWWKQMQTQFFSSTYEHFFQSRKANARKHTRQKKNEKRKRKAREEKNDRKKNRTRTIRTYIRKSGSGRKVSQIEIVVAAWCRQWIAAWSVRLTQTHARRHSTNISHST